MKKLNLLVLFLIGLCAVEARATEQPRGCPKHFAELLKELIAAENPDSLSNGEILLAKLTPEQLKQIENFKKKFYVTKDELHTAKSFENSVEYLTLVFAVVKNKERRNQLSMKVLNALQNLKEKNPLEFIKAIEVMSEKTKAISINGDLRLVHFLSVFLFDEFEQCKIIQRSLTDVQKRFQYSKNINSIEKYQTGIRAYYSPRMREYLQKIRDQKNIKIRPDDIEAEDSGLINVDIN